MTTFRFVGTSVSTVAGVELKRFGQKIQLDQPGKTPLVPADVFNKLFTEKEVVQYNTPARIANAPEAFVAKLRKAWAFFQTGKLPTEPATEKSTQ
jgi:hypothetical protein